MEVEQGPIEAVDAVIIPEEEIPTDLGASTWRTGKYNIDP